MKIVIAPDSFKESLQAVDVAKSISDGVKKVLPFAETILLPVGDGGEGTMSSLINSTEGEIVECYTMGPLGKYVESSYGVLGDGKTCVIEMASSSGLDLIEKDDREPLKSTSFGTGQLIKTALDDGYRDFIIGLGGSATNDGGAGMLQALGLKLFDKNKSNIGYGGESLGKVSTIDTSRLDRRLSETNFTIASDVNSPFIGENGATKMFGPQKGAGLFEIDILENNLEHFADKIEVFSDKRIHNIPGAGAGGGIGGAFLAFLQCDFQRGIDVVLDYVKFHSIIKSSDLVITGEGKVDGQTSFGKTPMGVAENANKMNVPTIVIAGAIEGEFREFYKNGVISVNSIVDKPMRLIDSMNKTEELLQSSTEQIIRNIIYQF